VYKGVITKGEERKKWQGKLKCNLLPPFFISSYKTCSPLLTSHSFHICILCKRFEENFRGISLSLCLWHCNVVYIYMTVEARKGFDINIILILDLSRDSHQRLRRRQTFLFFANICDINPTHLI
jgi:hypothetical protein